MRRHPLSNGRIVETRVNPFDPDTWIARWPWIGWQPYGFDVLMKTIRIRGKQYTAVAPHEGTQ